MARSRTSVVWLATLTSVSAGSPVAMGSGAPGGQVLGSRAVPTLEEITVVARRRDENLQRIPAAVSVLDGALLDATYTVNAQQVSQLIPSLYYSSANPRNTAYTIRGLGSNTLSISAANDGIEPGVGFYVDEVYHGRPASAAFDFTDVERIEVLRGPQGTLFGKNTTAGAIHVISREPTREPEGRAEVSVGAGDFFQARGSLSGALSESVAGRLSAQVTRRDGTLLNVRTGQRLNATNGIAARAQLSHSRSDGARVRFIADVSDIDAACCTQNYLRVGASRRSASRQFPALAAGLGYQPASVDFFDRVTDIDAPLGVDTQVGGLALLAEQPTAAGRLTAIAAWRYWTWDVANDRDFTGIPIQLVQRIPSRQDQYSAELRLASADTDRIGYVAGLYFFSQRIDAQPLSIYGPEAAYWLINPASFAVPIPRNLLDGYGQSGESHFESSSSAVFGEANYRLRDGLSATLGLRYTYEHKQGRYETTVSGGPGLDGLPAATAAELIRARLSIFRPQSYAVSDRGGNLSGRFNLSWQWTETVFAYAGYAQGFKSGGLNMSGLPLDAQNRPALATAIIEDEINRTVELGLKSTLFQGRGEVNLALYRTVVENYQANIVSSLETAALRSYPSNIPEVRVHGAELDVRARVLPRLALRASLAFADGRNTDYPAGPCPLEAQTATTLACDLTGRRLSGLSRWVGAVGYEFRSPVAGGAIVLQMDASARSRYNADTSASAFTVIPGHVVANARLGYELDDGWAIDVFARNLFDRDYITALTIQAGNSGLILGQPSEPRLVGVTARVRF